MVPAPAVVILVKVILCLLSRSRMRDVTPRRLSYRATIRRGTSENRDQGPTGSSVLVQVLLRNVILRNFPRFHFAFVRIRRILDAADDSGLEGLAFLDELLHALRIGKLGTGQPLNVARLAAGLGTWLPIELRFAGASPASNASR